MGLSQQQDRCLGHDDAGAERGKTDQPVARLQRRAVADPFHSRFSVLNRKRMPSVLSTTPTDPAGAVRIGPGALAGLVSAGAVGAGADVSVLPSPAAAAPGTAAGAGAGEDAGAARPRGQCAVATSAGGTSAGPLAATATGIPGTSGAGRAPSTPVLSVLGGRRVS